MSILSALKPYAEYKDSGSRWLSAVPTHWEVLPLGRLLTQRKEKNYPVKTNNILSLSLHTGVIPYSDKRPGGNKAKEDLSAYMLAYPGDIVLNSMNVVVGSVGLSEYFGAVSPVYYILYPRHADDSVEFFDAIFQDATFQRNLFGLGNGILVIQSRSTGKLNTIRMRIPMTNLRRVQLPYPGREEQNAIVRFLDYAKWRVERAIRTKGKMIALLNEQKQAVIHRAVTRGLDPSVPLKPSGIPWLGDIPEHWAIRPLKQLLARMDYGTSENARREGKVRVLTMGHIRDGKILFPQKGSLDAVPPGLLLEKNDLLFNRTNSPELVGKVGLFAGEASDEITFASYLVRLRVRSEHNPSWLTYLLNSPRFWSYARSQALVSLHQANLNSTRYGQMPLPVPPTRAEQNQIVELIRSQAGEVERATTCLEREIELLREYGTRLVADVVTGQIDVRGVSIPDIAQTELEKSAEIGVNDLIEDEPADEITNENNEN